MKLRVQIIIILVFVIVFTLPVFSQSTEFTYQGSLINSGTPANGSFDFEFALYDAAASGTQIGSTLTRNAVVASAGLFAVKLDFGSNFPGANRFLEIRVRQTGGGAYATLSPRSPINSSPYAIRSSTITGPVTGSNPTATLSVSNAQPGITNPSPANLPPAALRAESTATTDSNVGVIGIGDGTGGVGVGGISNGIAPVVSGGADAIGVMGLATATSGKSVGVSGEVYSPDGIAIRANSSNGGRIFVGSNDSTGDVFTVYSSGSVTAEGNVKATGNLRFGASLFGPNNLFAADSIGGLRVTGINVGQPDSADVFVVQPNGVVNAFGLYAVGLNVGPAGNTFVVGGDAVGVNGHMSVTGNFSVTGTKSSVAKLPDGRSVLLYALEGPENWFEDFGTVRLHNGRAVVKIDKTFAQTTNVTIPYKVFLTPNGRCRGLYVTRKTADSFEVREIGGGRSNVEFDFRIVARRIGYENVRFAPAQLPPTSKK